MPVHVYTLTPAGLALSDDAAPSLDDASLRLPDGAYTTLRTYQRTRILGLSAHLQRLVDSHALAGQNRPPDRAAIRAALRSVIAREGLPAARLRITAPFEGDAVFISIEPFESFPAECYTLGVRCRTTRRLTRHAPRAKLTGFIASSKSEKAKREADIHELLLVDARGKILEGVSSNFFAVLDGVLRTAGEGVLEGVTRGVVLAEAAELLPVERTPVGLADVPGLGEAFITSSSREVMPVVQIDGLPIGSGQPGPIAKAVLARYHAYLRRAAESP